MNKGRIATLSAVAAIIAVIPAAAQQQKRVSPHETVTAMVGSSKVTISYGRPYLKGREVFGHDLVPFGKVWRTGADEATKLTTDGALMIGTLKVPAGSYSLFTIPEKNSWTLVVNKTADQWGAYDYDAKMDLGRTPMTVKNLPAPVEQLTLKVDAGEAGASLLTISWENTMAAVPVKPAK